MNFSRKEVEPECPICTYKHICFHKMRATIVHVRLMFYHTQQQILDQTRHHPYSEDHKARGLKTYSSLKGRQPNHTPHSNVRVVLQRTESLASTLLTCEETSHMFGGRQSLLGGLSRSPKGQGIQPDACNAPHQKAVVTSYHWA